MNIIKKSVVEFRYRPAPYILDTRGAIAGKVTDGSTVFDEWRINENSISFSSSKIPNVKAFISHNRCGLAIMNPVSDEDFIKYTTDFVKATWNNLPYQTTYRLGIRKSYLFEADEKFEDILKLITSKFSVFDTSKLAPNLIDIAFTYNLLEDLTKINIGVGPMKKDQILENFTNQKDIPEIGIFIDIDTFKEDFEANMKQKNYLEFIEGSKDSANRRANTIYEMMQNEKK